VTVQQLWRDLELIISRIASFVDDKGAPLFPDFDPEKHLQIVAPPCLRPAGRLAWQMVGAQVGGANGTSGSSGSTTSIGPTQVAEVLYPGLLQGCPDIDSEVAATISPQFETQYYVNIKDDYVRPWYFQRFRPKKGSDFVPAGYDPEAVADAAIAAAMEGLDGPSRVTPEAADMYAMTIIDTNVGAIGQNAQRDVVTGERFFMSGRTRFQVFAGPWFLTLKIDPTGDSI